MRRRAIGWALDRQAEDVSGGDPCDARKTVHLDWCGHGSDAFCAKAQLTLAIEAPRPERAVALYCHAVATSRSNGGRARETAHLHGDGAADCRAVAQFPASIRAPRPNGSVAL